MFVLLSSFQRVKNGRVFPAFYHATFQHALIMCCNVSRAIIARMYHDWNTFDFMSRPCDQESTNGSPCFAE